MIIGITGGIGSGKSTIAKALAQRGCTVYDCDREAKRIIEENKKVQQQIIDLLGPEAFSNSQSLCQSRYNTAYVSQRVFAEPELLKALNAIIHPAVIEDIQRQTTNDKRLFFIESAILYEAGLDTLCNKVFIIDAPEDIRIARTIQRDYQGAATQENIDKVRARMRAQQLYPKRHTPYTLLNNDGHTPIDELASQLLRDVE